MWLLFIGGFLSVAAVSGVASDTTLVLSAADVACTLPLPARIARGSWTMADYSTADLYSFRLDVPVPRPTVEATALSATYGDWLHVFVAAVPEFLNTVELLGRLMDMQQLRRSSRGDAPVMMTYSAQRMIGAAPAEEIAIELRDTTAKDSLFTLITSAARGKDLVLIILRSRINPRSESTESAQIYRKLLASIEMKRLFTLDTAHLINPSGWRLAIPHAWKNKVTTRLETMPFVPSSGEEDTVWNTVVVQLPTVQIEYFVTASPHSDSALADYANHIASRRGLQPMHVSDQYRLSGKTGLWYHTTSLRRGDVVETRYGVFPLQGRIAIIRLTGWQRDMVQLDRFVPDFLGLLTIPSVPKQ